MQLKKKNSMYMSDAEKKKERKKRGNRKYGQGKLKHAKKGVLSCTMASAAVLLLLGLILCAFLLKGQTIALIGSLGIFTVILSAAGLVNALRGFRERDKNYLTCKVGAGMNGAVLLALIAIFIRGLI